MRTGWWTTGAGLAEIALLAIGIAAPPAMAKPSPAAKCAAAKASATGRALGGSLACESKARGKAVETSSACVDKTAQRFDSAFADAGAACPGDADGVQAVLAECRSVLTGDVSGTGKCPRASLRALATGGQGLGICAARDALHAGKGAACRAKALSKLDAALGKASACTAVPAHDHLVDCWSALLATLAGTPTTTTTGAPATTATTSTSLAATTTTGVATTSTTSSTAADTTTTDAATTSTSSSSTIEDTTTTDAATTSTTSSTETTTTTECATVDVCGGEQNECRARACLDGICGFTYTPADTVVTDQNLGNCRNTLCDGAGGFVESTNDADLPNDGNECTDDVCMQGVPTNPLLPAGSPCSDGVCDGNGSCVACLVAEDCPGSDTECMVRTCLSGTCGASFTPAGTPVAAQAIGDCHVQQCDGAGGVENAVDDSDADDGNECTTDACLAGTPSHEPLPDMTPCDGGECNLGFCCAVGQTCG